MRPRDVLAENLKTLMAGTPGLSRFPDIVERSNKVLTNGTLDRIRRASHATSIDTLAELARVYGIEPWQLLSPGLKVTAGKAEAHTGPLSPEALSLAREVDSFSEGLKNRILRLCGEVINLARNETNNLNGSTEAEKIRRHG